MRPLVRRAGNNKRVGPHTLRHALIVAGAASELTTCSAPSTAERGVVAGEVVDAADRWVAAEGGVAAAMVVGVEPLVEFSSTAGF